MSSELRVDKIVPTDGVPTGGGGGIVQVVESSWSGNFTTGSTSYVDLTNATITITPKFSTSKILIQGSINSDYARQSNDLGVVYTKIIRVSDSAEIDEKAFYVGSGVSNTGFYYQPLPLNYLAFDSPNTTSQVTYKIQVKIDSAGSSALLRNQQINNGVGVSRLVAMEVSA